MWVRELVSEVEAGMPAELALGQVPAPDPETTCVPA